MKRKARNLRTARALAAAAHGMELTCPRCGKPTKGMGKTPLCQPCASSFNATKYWSRMFRQMPHPAKISTVQKRCKQQKVTLAPIGNPK